MSELYELSDGRKAPVELVGRVSRWMWGNAIEMIQDREVKPISVGNVLLFRPSLEGDYPWRKGMLTVDGVTLAQDSNTHLRISGDVSGVTALAGHDFVYRIGIPTTPSLDERVMAIERLLGLVADDLEVASDADALGRVEEAVHLRARAIERIRKMTQASDTVVP